MQRPERYEDSVIANDFIELCGGLEQQSDDAPCLKELAEALPIGSDSAIALRSSVAVMGGDATWRGGENLGHHGLAVRKCGRVGCAYQCELTVSKDHEFLKASDKPFWTEPEKQVCSNNRQSAI